MEDILLVIVMIAFILLSIQLIMDIKLTRKQYKYFMELRSGELDGKRKSNKKIKS